MKRTFLIFMSLFFAITAWSQPLIVDEVVAVIGDKKVLYSDIEEMVIQIKQQTPEQLNANTRCEVLEDLMVQQLLVNQAEIDSVLVSDGQVDMELNQRMNYFVNQIGSEERLEAYFGKSMIEIRNDLRSDIRDQLLANGMRSKVTQNISVTPSEVRTYFRSLPADSLPYINAEFEYNQLVIYPKSTEEANFSARDKLLEIRERVLKGESFITLAVVYSEDEASAIRGGEIGWFAMSDLDPEYSKAASALKPGAISKIVESSFGLHLIQLIDKTEDRIHTRHILIRPKISPEVKQQTLTRLDSIVGLVKNDSLSFIEAATLYSEDVDTKVNGGQVVNPMRGGSRFRMDEFEPTEYSIINNLNVGEISMPYEATDNKGNLVYKVLYLKNRTQPHVANLQDDYSLFMENAMRQKENEIVNKWVESKIKSTYIKISDRYNSCVMSLEGWPNMSVAESR